MLTLIKSNPLKSSAAIIASLTIILSSAFAVDSRYVKSDDLKTVQAQQTSQLTEIKKTIQLNELSAQKRYTKQQIFSINLKEKPSNVDKAMLQ